MSINEIQNLIRFVAKSGVREIELEMKEFKIIIKNINSAVEIRYEESPVFNAITHTISAIQPPVISTQP